MPLLGSFGAGSARGLGRGASPIIFDILVLASGSGAHPRGGGGGAGGLQIFESQSIVPGSYNILVGAGGAGISDPNNYVNTPPGNPSQFGTLAQSLGGGYSGWNQTGGNGGCGGGGGAINGSPGTSGGTGTAGQGFNGGGSIPYFNSPFPCGGGGGAGAAGSNSPNGSTGGNGGNGRTSAIINAFGSATSTGQLSGGNYYYGGGGGGGLFGSGTVGSGGLGGGGTNGSNGSANMGGGGSSRNNGGSTSGQSNGGSGLVIVRYSGGQQASGGEITSSGGFTYHAFKSAGTFSFTL
jgi:hypothetical protein